MRFKNTLLALAFSWILIGTIAADEDVLLVDDFENGAGAPKGWTKGPSVPGVKFKYDKKQGKSGKRSLSLHKTEQRYFPVAQWSRKLKCKNEKNGLQISIQVKAKKMTKAVVDVIFLDDNNEWISHEWACYIGAKNDKESPANHDWKEYSAKVEIPEGTYRIQLALQIYGPGKVWFDDLKATYVDADVESSEANEDAHENMHKVSIGDAQGSYLYVAPKKEPNSGSGLLLVLPGGDGSADFHPFVKNIHRNCLEADFALAQPIAKKWTRSQQIVWPTVGSKVKKMGYTTEALIESVIKDVGKKIKLDSKRIYVLAWSSGGPAAYAALLQEDSALSGGFLAMSVFKPDQLPDLENGKNRGFYILHSKNDKICPYWMAQNASEMLSKSGVKNKLAHYSGGHGWHGNVFGNISNGIEWLEKASK